MDSIVMEMARREGCVRCAFGYVNETRRERTGKADVVECRRAPPRTSSEHRFPFMRTDGWCGAWAPLLTGRDE